MLKFQRLFRDVKCAIIGMIHVRALPGTPKSEHSVQHLVDIACEEAEIYQKHCVDGLLIENMHDVPYIMAKDTNPEVTAIMTRVCTEVKRLVPHMPCGIQILAGNNISALAVALAADLQFIRAENYIFGHIADEGFMQACAGPLLRYRHFLKADKINIFTDIKKKHSSHAVTSDIDIGAAAKAAQFFLSDGVILTGQVTGDPPSLLEINSVRMSVSIPVIIGSGVTVHNIQYYSNVQGVIIGSHFKTMGKWEEKLNKERIGTFMDKIMKLR